MGMPSTFRHVWLAFGLGCALIVGVGVVAWRIMVLQQTAHEARDHLTAARAAISDVVAPVTTDAPAPTVGQLQLTSACTEASAAAESLRDVNGQLQTVMPLVSALEALPGLGPRARSQTASLQVGTELATAGTSLCDGLGPLSALLTGASSNGGPQSTHEIMVRLIKAQPHIVEAILRLEQLQTSLNDVQEGDLEPANRTALVSIRERLPQMLKAIRDASVYLDLMGAERARRYLLVSQNPDELRATGGFIGSAGIVVAAAGDIRLVEYGTSHRYDTPLEYRAIPPAEFRAYLGQNSWNLAGANWWMSYPDVARQLAYFYELSHPREPLDGVIALDQVGLERMLAVLGPVDVPEYSERVSAADLQAKLDHYVHAGDWTDESRRKQFTAALSAAVLQGLLQAPGAQLPAVVKAVRATLEEQHLLVWMNEPEAQRLFASKRWDGALLPANSDSLMLIDTDVVGSKQSQMVARDATYSVAFATGEQPRAALEVVYTNNARREQRPEVQFVPTYRTFLQVIVPTGAELTSSSGFDDGVSTLNECGRQVFAGRVTIAERAATHIRLDYRLPSTVSSGDYDLLVQQQPNVPPGRVAVSVSSPGKALAHAEMFNTSGQHAHWHLDSSDTPLLRPASLPEAAPGGCGFELVEAQPVAAPVSLTIASARITAAVVELGVSADGQMEAPPTPDVVGWYRMSARPGQPGNSVFSGHVDWGRDTAVFWGLRSLHKGESIVVAGADGVSHTYAIDWNESFPWQTAPVNRIVGPSADSILTLITCDGVYDKRSQQYSERRVVRAHLAD